MDLRATQANVHYVMPFLALTRADVSRVGAKAANLGEPARAGFPVPDGFALSVHAFDHFVEHNELDESKTPESIFEAELPGEVKKALCVVARKLDGRPLRCVLPV